MEKIEITYNSLARAVASLEKAIQLVERAKVYTAVEFHPCDEIILINIKELSMAFYDSMIYRFKYSVDLMWQYLKDYLEFTGKMVPELQGHKNIIRSCGQVGILNEQDAIQMIEMLDSRNISSHIDVLGSPLQRSEDGVKEVAQQMEHLIPTYYKLMVKVLDKTKP